jgi:hypothetical protein
MSATQLGTLSLIETSRLQRKYLIQLGRQLFPAGHGSTPIPCKTWSSFGVRSHAYFWQLSVKAKNACKSLIGLPGTDYSALCASPLRGRPAVPKHYADTPKNIPFEGGCRRTLSDESNRASAR